MLQNIRNNIQGTMAKVVVAIIAVPFALFGIESLFSGGGPAPVAEVNGTAISELELNNAISLQQRQLIAMMEGRADPALLDQERLRGPVLERMIRELVLLDEAQRLGLAAPETLIDQSIVALPQFQENGRFSVERYQSVLRMQGLTPAGFKEQLRRDLLVQQLLQGIGGSSFVSGRELADIARLLEQTRSFSYALIDASDMEAALNLEENDLRAYYQANAEAFMRPEQVKVSYINVRLEDFFEPVDEEVLQAELARIASERAPSTQRHAAHILIEVGEQGEQAALEKAEALYAELQAGADFEALAREHSSDAGSSQSGGDLGVSSGDAFPPAFESALAALEEGQVSQPVRTEAGFHLIKLLDVEAGEPADLDQLRAELADTLQRREAEPRLVRTVERLRDLSFNADGLRQPARELDLELSHHDWMALDGGTGVLADPRVRSAMTSSDVLEDRHNSEVVELASDHFVVVHVDERREAKLREFDEVRERVNTLATRERAEQLARETADQVVRALQSGQSFADVAEARDLTWQRAQAVKRNAVAVPEEVRRLAFSQPHPGDGHPVVSQATLSDGSALVLALESVSPGDVADMDPGQRQALQGQLADNHGQAAFAAYLDRVQREADIERM